MPFSFALCLPLPIPPSTPPFRISIVETIRLTSHPIPKSFRNHANITHSAPTKPTQPLGYPYSQTPPSLHLKPLIPTLDSSPFCLIAAFSSSDQHFAIGFLQLLITTMSLPNRQDWNRRLSPPATRPIGRTNEKKALCLMRGESLKASLDRLT